MIGRVLDDRYAIVRQLGQGGMGAVYEARHTGTGRRVAVKVILDRVADDDMVRRFQREARAVGAVESEHIAQVFDTGRDRETGAPYIAMEFLEGEDVQSLIDRLGPLPVDLALRIGLQACLGLAGAHAAGVVHRDIKPANLFLARKPGGQRVIKLLDFGVAKMSDHTLGNGAMTKSGALLGSPLYMSPEQARGSGAVDARSDLWSLGITLYHALTGRLPNGHLTGLGELVLAICTTPTRWLPEVAPWVPLEVARVVHRTLVIDPAGRTASAGELAAALRALLPDGEAITDAMLVPLGADARASRPLMDPRAAGSRPSMDPHAAGSRPSMGSVGTAPPALLHTAPATSVELSSRHARPAPRAPVVLLVGGVMAAAVAGGVGVFLAVRAGSPPAASPAEAPAHAEAEAPTRTGGEPSAHDKGEPPARTEAEPPAHTEAEPPAHTEGEPPARTEAEPPARTEAEPPARTEGESRPIVAPAPVPPLPPAGSASEAPRAPAASATSTAPLARSSVSTRVVVLPSAPRPSAIRPAPIPRRTPRNDDDETSRK